MAPTLSEELGLSAADVLEYHRNNLNSDVLELFCHGVYTCVYVYSICEIGTHSNFATSLSLLTPRNVASSSIASHKSIKRRGFHAILITIMWSLATLIFGVRWYYLSSTYVDHGDSRESAFDFSASGFSTVISIVSRVSLSINVLIADCILVSLKSHIFIGTGKVTCCTVDVAMLGNLWWVLGYHNPPFFVPPCRARYIISYTYFSSLIYDVASCVLLLISNYDGGSVVSITEIDWNIVYYSMTVATNILCTGSIVLRIIYISRTIRTYRGIIEILVESAMLYSVTYITYIAVYAYAYNDVSFNESHYYPGAMLSAVTVSLVEFHHAPA